MEFKLQSDEIDKLTAAFVEAKKEFKPFRATGKGNWGEYLTIDDMGYATDDAFLKNGIMLEQGTTVVEGQIYLITQISLGNQWKRSIISINVPENAKSRDQSIGSSLSYQKRYALYGLLGCKGEDLDPDSIQEDTRPSEFISDKQVGYLKMLLRNHPESMEKTILEAYKISSLDKVPKRDMDKLVNRLQPKGQ